MSENTKHPTTVEQRPTMSPMEMSYALQRAREHMEQSRRALVSFRDEVRLLREHAGSSDAHIVASQAAIERSQALLARHRQETSTQETSPKDPLPTDVPTRQYSTARKLHRASPAVRSVNAHSLVPATNLKGRGTAPQRRHSQQAVHGRV